MTDNGITKKDIITATTMTVASGGTTGIITVHRTLTSLPSCARGAKPYRRRYPCDQQEGRKVFESADSSHRVSGSNPYPCGSLAYRRSQDKARPQACQLCGCWASSQRVIPVSHVANVCVVSRRPCVCVPTNRSHTHGRFDGLKRPYVCEGFVGPHTCGRFAAYQGGSTPCIWWAGAAGLQSAVLRNP